jgi:O-antigen ligase
VTAVWTLPEVHRRRAADAADYLAIALVVSLPWSTSATAILVVLWLIALLPTLDRASIHRTLATPAGGLPVLLVALAALGMAWADVAWSSRVEGFVSYLKLAVIPLFFVQFGRSERASWAIYALLAACTVLLAASYAAAAFPEALQPLHKDSGVVVKSYISQSGFFTIAVFVLADMAYMRWRDGQRALASAAVVLAALFLANMVLVVTGRTALLVLPVLVLLYGLRRAGWKGVLAASLAGLVMATIAWSVSPYLRLRVQSTWFKEIKVGDHLEPSPTALRLAFWRASFAIVRQAPLVGHGTGSIRAQFERYAATHVNSYVDEATNPHNQTFAVAIQLGLLGALVLYAMWLFHFLLFRGNGLMAWFGTVVVVQNFIGSLVNTHLFDVTQGWSYAVLVGIAGGAMLHKSSPVDAAAVAAPAQPAEPANA